VASDQKNNRKSIGDQCMTFEGMGFVAFVFGLLFFPIIVGVLSFLSLVTIVRECEVHVYTLFGRVLGVIEEPGLRCPLLEVGILAILVPFFGKKDRVSIALKQFYLRSQMVNSEEGTPMSVGVWYEMKVVDPVAYLFNNADPEGSLRANVINSTISMLSNLEMETMLEDRHALSRRVREAVSPLSLKWGYELGSVYIRKVAFTDKNVVENITDKVVKRLVQVTSAIRQDGENRVGLIRSETAKRVSQQMAEAAAMYPKVVGEILNQIQKKDPEILDSVLEIREFEQIMASGAEVELVGGEQKLLLTI
jgi:regulator of protease activity HflC (stomatin/prohibitin superfamily)